MRRQLMALTCWLGLAAGIWLAVMENVLKHEGYAGRTAIAACIAMQSLATLLLVARPRGFVFRRVVMAGAVGIVVLGGYSVLRILDAPHFEGFVLVIGAALILQGGLTLISGEWPRREARF